MIYKIIGIITITAICFSISQILGLIYITWVMIGILYTVFNKNTLYYPDEEN